MIDKKYFVKFSGNSGITKGNHYSNDLPPNIPADYYDLLEMHNGGEGLIGEEYVVLFKMEDLTKLNQEYKVSHFAPGIFLFGSNGAGEALAFDLRQSKGTYILIPFTFEYDSIIKLGTNLEEFLNRIYTKGFFT